MNFRKIRHYFCNIKVFVLLITSAIVLSIVLHEFYFSKWIVKYIALDDIPSQLVPVYHNLKLLASNNIPVCHLMPSLVKEMSPIPTNLTVDETVLKSLAVKLKIRPGGAWKPTSCISRHHVAIVVVYRDRMHNLHMFLSYMHQFLQNQMLDYRIIVVEQNNQNEFNRGKLFNVGFKEAGKIDNFPCFIFSDVDLLPLNPKNIYACTQLPRHMSANIDKFGYQLPYYTIFGGVSSMLKTQFESANGFSNLFVGWGGEDDDLFNRLTRNGTSICRFEADISKYVMLSHETQQPNDKRYSFLVNGVDRFDTDGLNSLNYTVEEKDYHPLYTRLLVDV